MKKFSSILLVSLCCFTSNLFGQTIPNYVPTNGLVAWWPFNGNANDESGNGNNGVVNGALLTTDRNGNSNNAYHFSSSGCGTYIQANINTSSIQNGLTISIWALRNGNGCLNPRLLEFWPGSDGPGQATWAWSNILSYGVYGATNSNNVSITSLFNPVFDDEWVNLIFTNDGAFGKFYQNGILINTIAANGNPILSGNASFGRANHPGYDALNGNLDDIGIWNRALTQQEISNLFTGATPTPCSSLPVGLQSGLVGYWPFCGNANDESGNGNNGTLLNGVTSTSDRNGIANSAYSFDGINDFILVNNSNSLNPTALTINCWIYALDSNSAIITKSNPNNATEIGYNLTLKDEQAGWHGLRSILGHGICTDLGFLDWGPQNSVPENQWVMISLTTNSNGDVKQYINGVLNYSYSTGFPFNPCNSTSSTLRIGGLWWNNDPEYFSGKIDDICIWNRVLSQQEITSLFTGVIPPPCASLPAGLQSGLVGYWPFCGNAFDESGNGNNGVVNGALLISDRFGNSNSAYNFNGSSYIQVADNNLLDFGVGSFAISTWVNCSIDSSQMIIHKGSDYNVPQYFLRINENDSTDLILLTSSGGVLNENHTGINNVLLENNQWHHIVAQRKVDTLQLYFDNLLIYSAQEPLRNVNNNFPLFFGAQNNTNLLNFLKGNLDDIGMWNRALSQQEITELFTGVVSPPCASLPTGLQSGLVGYWPFCGNANDESGNGNNGTVNGASLTSDRFGNANTAYSFDGLSNYISTANINLPDTATISVWVNPTLDAAGNNSWTYSASLVDQNQDASNNSSYGFYYNNMTGQGLYAAVGYSGNANTGITSQVNLSLNNWHHCVLTLNNGTGKLYMDGVLIKTQTGLTSTAQTGNLLLFGKASWASNANLFSGKLDDIAIWNRTLTPTEVGQLYTSQFPCNSLVNFMQADTIPACGSSYILDAGAGFDSYTWSNGGTTQNISATNSGWYTCTVTLNSCTIVDSVYLSLLNARIEQSDTTICLGASINLNVVQFSGNGNITGSLQNGLIAFYPFNGNTNDHSGNNNNGIPNAIQYSNDRFGNSNSSGNFNGSSSYVLVPNSGTLLLDGANKTYSFWMNVPSYPTDGIEHYFFSKHLGTGNAMSGIHAALSNYFGGQFLFYRYRSGNSSTWGGQSTSYSNFPALGTWFHILFIVGVSEDSLFVNGVFKFSAPASVNGSNSNPMYLGVDGNSFNGLTDGYYNGLLDDVAFWNRSLNIGEIQNLYQSGPSLSYVWSTGDTTSTINVTPTQTTTYYVSMSNGISTCTDSVTVTVIPGSTAYYADNDNDGFGGVLLGYYCIPPLGGILQSGDCNDANSLIYPGATEICNAIDDNCNGIIDDGLLPNVGAISGTANACILFAAGSTTFSIPAIPGATNYTWSVPSNVTISSGIGTNSITIAWTAIAAHDGIVGQVCVVGYNACGSSTPSCINIAYTYTSPVTPPSISGAARICPGDLVTYSISPVARASYYTWVAPTGVSILTGQGSNVITTSIDPSFTGGALTVSAGNACGISPVRTRNLIQNILPVPGTISGFANGVCSTSGATYSILPIVGASGYSWTIPVGATLVSQTGNSITVNFSNTFTSGSISVTANNNCGAGSARSLTVIGSPSQPGIISGPTAICPGAVGLNYSVATVPGTSTYTWIVPGTATITGGQGTKIITVDWNSTPVSGQNISVKASNNCGISSSHSLNGISVNAINCARITDKNSDQSIVIYPNPVNDILYLKAINETPIRIEMMNILGEILINQLWSSEINVKHLNNGIYILKVYSTNEINSFKVEILR